MKIKVPIRIEIWEEKNPKASFFNREPFLKFRLFDADNKEVSVDRYTLRQMVACFNDIGHKYEPEVRGIPSGIVEPQPCNRQKENASEELAEMTRLVERLNLKIKILEGFAELEKQETSDKDARISDLEYQIAELRGEDQR